MIPKIIHQTWKDPYVPQHLSVLSETWKEKHPTWEFKLWTDKMNRDFIEEYNADFLNIYDNYPYNIQRVDAVRYFILYEMGGVFIDLDFRCLHNIESLLEDQDCIFGIEPDKHSERFNKKMTICNAFMACNSKNFFFKTICDELKNGYNVKDSTMPFWLQVLESTGPFKLTKIFDRYEDKSSIKLLSANIIYPLTLSETRELFTKASAIDEHMQSRIENAYAIHYFMGSWLHHRSNHQS